MTTSISPLMVHQRPMDHSTENLQQSARKFCIKCVQKRHEIGWHIKLRVREPPGSLYNVFKVSAPWLIYSVNYTMASSRASPIVVNVNLRCPFINHNHGLNPHLVRVYVYRAVIGQIKHALKSSACAV